MPPAEPTVTVIVPVRNGARSLAACVGAIAADPYPDVRREVIVADNGSSDGSMALAQSLGARVISKPDLKVSALRNEAVRQGNGELLAFIDVDHTIAPGWLSAAVDTLSDPGVAAAGAPYHAPAAATWVQSMYDAMRDHPSVPTDTRWLGSGNLVVRRRVFEDVGGFDATLEACEDVDLCRRLRATGARLVSTPEMVSLHYGDPATLGALFRSELWRGRDNLRVSLRRPIAWRDLPSIVVPLLWLIVAATSLVTLVRPRILLPWAVAGFCILGLAASFRAAGMIRRARLTPGLAWGQALVVATVYDMARGLSLLARATHRTRHTAGAP